VNHALGAALAPRRDATVCWKIGVLAAAASAESSAWCRDVPAEEASRGTGADEGGAAGADAMTCGAGATWLITSGSATAGAAGGAAMPAPPELPPPLGAAPELPAPDALPEDRSSAARPEPGAVLRLTGSPISPVGVRGVPPSARWRSAGRSVRGGAPTPVPVDGASVDGNAVDGNAVDGNAVDGNAVTVDGAGVALTPAVTAAAARLSPTVTLRKIGCSRFTPCHSSQGVSSGDPAW
jgi:hypothetical protein